MKRDWIRSVALSRFLPSICAWGVVAVGSADAAQQTLPPGFPLEIIDPHRTLMAGVSSQNYKQGYHLMTGGQFVRRLRQERADTSAQWKAESDEYTTSYFLTAWCAREGGDEIYLAGLKPTGGVIVERWTFSVPARRWVVRYPGPTPPIGNPAPAFTPQVTVLGNGTWKWTKALPYPPNPQRTVVLEDEGGAVTAMDVDPEGRQLVVYDHALKALSRIRLDQSPAQRQVLFEAAAFPHLSQVATLEFADFPGEGRKLHVTKQLGQTFASAEEVYSIATDADNDGNFESLHSYDVGAYQASPYHDWNSWTEFWRLD